MSLQATGMGCYLDDESAEYFNKTGDVIYHFAIGKGKNDFPVYFSYDYEANMFDLQPPEN